VNSSEEVLYHITHPIFSPWVRVEPRTPRVSVKFLIVTLPSVTFTRVV